MLQTDCSGWRCPLLICGLTSLWPSKTVNAGNCSPRSCAPRRFPTEDEWACSPMAKTKLEMLSGAQARQSLPKRRQKKDTSPSKKRTIVYNSSVDQSASSKCFVISGSDDRFERNPCSFCSFLKSSPSEVPDGAFAGAVAFRPWLPWVPGPLLPAANLKP